MSMKGQACPIEKCGSSDAYFVYPDGHGHCYSCSYHHGPGRGRGRGDYRGDEEGEGFSKTTLGKQQKPTGQQSMDTSKYNYLTTAIRGLNSDCLKKYGVTVGYHKDNPTAPHHIRMPLGDPNNALLRTLGEKSFVSVGTFDKQKMFGVDAFTAGSADKVVITEGCLDAVSVYQMVGGKYPTVSIRSASTAKKDAAFHYEFLNSFPEIVLCLDADAPGLTAAKAIASLFNGSKVKFVALDPNLKDANAYLQAGRIQEFVKALGNAQSYKPKDIIGHYEEIKRALAKKSSGHIIGSFPFPDLDRMTYGIQSSGVYLFTAQEKIGKTEVMRAIEFHLLKTTKHPIGIIHLEETERRTICGLAGYELRKPVHLPDSDVSDEQVMEAYKKLTEGREDRVFMYSHFGSDDPDTILDVIRFMVTGSGCKFIFLDHITMLVTGFEGDDERKKLDYLSTRLAMMTRELDFTLFMVSHVNDDGKTRSSRNIGKVANVIIALDRDIENPDPDIRNTTKITVKGNRDSAHSGPASPLFFDIDTYTLSEKQQSDTVDAKTKEF